MKEAAAAAVAAEGCECFDCARSDSVQLRLTQNNRSSLFWTMDAVPFRSFVPQAVAYEVT